MTDFINLVLFLSTYVILLYFFLINTFYLLFTILSLFGLHRYQNKTAYVSLREAFQSPLTKPISILLPAFNEEKNIIESIRSLLALEYPTFEVIVINDGSTDSTLDVLIETYKLKISSRVYKRTIHTETVKNIYISATHPQLVVMDKKNGKKADALNAGLNLSRYPLFCSVDSDSILEKDALLKIIRPFLTEPDSVMGAGGIIRLVNGCSVRSGIVEKIGMPRNIIARFQILEYLRAFLGGRMGLSMLKSILIISGAFAAFRKDIALECGGYRRSTVAEDMDLVVRMHRYLHDHKLKGFFYFIPDPICWTEAPESLRVLAKQRNRWHRGLIQSLTYNIKMLFNPRYKTIGLLAMPFYIIFEMFGPLIEFIGYLTFLYLLITGDINYPFALIFFILAVVYGIVLSLSAILLEEFSLRRYPRLRDIFIIITFGFLENIFYRQYLTLVRVWAFFDYILGKKEWGRMRRKGFNPAKEKINNAT